MNKFQTRVMINVHAADKRSFISVSDPNQIRQLLEEGWATVFIKEFQFRLVKQTLEVRVSKPIKGHVHGRPQQYSRITAERLASSKDCDEFNHVARSLFVGFDEPCWVFWRSIPIDASSPRTCGVFRQVDDFTPSDNQGGYVVSFNLGSRELVLSAEIASELDVWGPKAEAIYKSERSLVYQAVRALT